MKLLDATALIAAPEWSPRGPARHFLPALSILSPAQPSFRFELSIRVRGEWSPWVAAASIGPEPFEPISAKHEWLASEVDVFVTSVPAERVRLRVRIRDRDVRALLAAPWVVTLSACDPGAMKSDEGAPSPSATIAVRPLSQMEEVPSLRHRICSPTSVAMILERWGRRAEPATLASEMFHSQLDIYGVWPAAVAAAARRGVAGYLLRFPSWAAAAWCLAAGLPIVASVRYAKGELAGAAIDATDGHLIVLTGYEGDDVLVNDPAAPGRATVPRRYRLEDIERVWLERAGVGYVFFDPLSDGGHQRC